MIRALRHNVAQRIAETVAKQPNTRQWNDDIDKLEWCIRFGSVKKRSDISRSQVFVPFNYLRACGLTGLTSDAAVGHALTEQFKPDTLIGGIAVSKDGIGLTISAQHLTQSVLSDISMLGAGYGHHSDLYQFKLTGRSQKVIEESTGQNIVVEYSSPNIAKPFHAGHLRSTILGQFISNICSHFQQNVVRLNYLGDWGTQFGLLGVGFAKYGDKDALNASPMQHLFDVYVKINKDLETDASVRNEGMEYFRRMEQGDNEALSFWRMCRDLSLEEYLAMYKRLGVSFTHIHSESMYQDTARQLIIDLDNAGILQRDSKTGVGYIDLTHHHDKGSFYANLVKSDGTTLYITRDIVAAIDRQKTFGADQLFYVVENGQHVHFQQLCRSLSRLGHDWIDKMVASEFHVKFGHVEGMSTRRGQVVLLRDILDEAKSRMLETMASKSTTKVTEPNDVVNVAEMLGTSAVLIQDMKEYRLSNYRFNWEKIFNFSGDTGVFLQYTHARLHSIVSAMEHQLLHCQPDFACLTEDSARRLVQHLARFDEVLLKSYSELEPCHLVHYLFNIGRLVNVTHDELYVKNQPDVIAKTRLVLFQCAKTVLSNGLSILGIRPLDRL